MQIVQWCRPHAAVTGVVRRSELPDRSQGRSTNRRRSATTACAAAAQEKEQPASTHHADSTNVQQQSQTQPQPQHDQQKVENGVQWEGELQQEQQPPKQHPDQQPQIVLTPLSSTAAGSILRSSQLGSWSAMGPADLPGGYTAQVKRAATQQQQQQQGRVQQQRKQQGSGQQQEQHRSKQQAQLSQQEQGQGHRRSEQQQLQQEGEQLQQSYPQQQKQQKRQKQKQKQQSPGPSTNPQQQQQQQVRRQQQHPQHPQQQARKQQQHQQQQQQQQSHTPGRQQPTRQHSPAAMARHARRVTSYLSSANSIPNLLYSLTKVSPEPTFNLVHVATAYKVLAQLCTQQPQQQQEQQQLELSLQQQRQQQLKLTIMQQQHGRDRLDASVAVAAASATVPPEQTLDHTLLLLDRLAAEQLAAAASSKSSGAQLWTQSSSSDPSNGSSSSSNSSSSSSTSAAQALEPAQAVRALAMIVNSCARMQYAPPCQLLWQLLEAFLATANEEQQQQQQQGPIFHDLGPQQQQHQQQQQLLLLQDRGTALPQLQLSSSLNSSSSSRTHSRSSYSSSSPLVVEHATCLALSLMCNGLSKLGFTCSSVYQPVSSSSMLEEQELQRRLQQQQQYWQRLAAVASRVVQAGFPREVSTLCHAFAAGGHKDILLWGRLGPCVVDHMHSFTPQEYSQTLWAFATVGVQYKPLVPAACSVAPQLTPGLTPQGLCNVLWAMTMLAGHVPSAVLDPIQEACLRMDLDRFGSVNIATLIGAFTRHGSMPMELAVALNRAVVRTLPKFAGDNLCKVLSGLAVLNCLQQPLLQAAQPRLLAMLRDGSIDVQQACHGVWGVAITEPQRAQVLLPPLLKLASRHIHLVTRSSDCTSKLCSALAAARYRDDAFVDRLAQFLLAGRADTAATAAEAAAAAARAGVGMAGAGAGTAVSVEVGGVAGGLQRGAPLALWNRPATPHHLTSIANMLAKLGFSQHQALLQGLIKHFLLLQPPPDTNQSSYSRHGSSSDGSDCSSTVSSFKRPQQAVTLLWCAAVLDMRQPRKLLRELLLHLRGATALPTAVMAQLVQVNMWLETFGNSSRALTALIPSPLLSEALTLWRQELVPTVVLSQLHSQVMGQLAAMGLNPVAEGVTRDGMFSVDIIVNYRGCAVAVEVLGPDHYTANTVRVDSAAAPQQQQGEGVEQQHALLGPELLRFRLLAVRGLALAAVSSFEAAGAVSTAAGAQALRRLLKYKLQEAVQLHGQPTHHVGASAEGTPAGEAAATVRQAGQGKRRGAVSAQPKQPMVQQGQDPLLSRLLLQPGFSEKQQRVRRSRAQHLQQQQQQRENGRRLHGKQQAVQTLLTAAVVDQRAGRATAPPAAAGAGGKGGGGVDGVMTSSVESAEFDLEFDLPLNLEELT